MEHLPLSAPSEWPLTLCLQDEAKHLSFKDPELFLPGYYWNTGREQARNSCALSAAEDTTLSNKQNLWYNHSACQHPHLHRCPACNIPMIIKVAFVSTAEIVQQIAREARLASVFVSACSSIYSISFGSDLFHSHLFDLLPRVHPKPLLSSFSSFLGLYYCSLMALISHF